MEEKKYQDKQKDFYSLPYSENSCLFLTSIKGQCLNQSKNQDLHC